MSAEGAAAALDLLGRFLAHDEWLRMQPDAEGVYRMMYREDATAALAVVAQALAAREKDLVLAQIDREGDWATLADRLNSCLREASLPEVPARVERIKDGMMSLLYELNRTKISLARCESDGQRLATYLDAAETRAEVAEAEVDALRAAATIPVCGRCMTPLRAAEWQCPQCGPEP